MKEKTKVERLKNIYHSSYTTLKKKKKGGDREVNLWWVKLQVELLKNIYTTFRKRKQMEK